jgi:uncharacterized protein (DUF1800 family)
VGKQRNIPFIFLFAIAIGMAGCGGGGSAPPPPPPVITVVTSPTNANIRAGDSFTFTDTVTGTTNTAVTWSVNGTPGGDAAHGTISSTGTYTAPNTLPSPNTVTVQATSFANGTSQGSSGVTLQNPIPVVTAVNPTTIGVGAFTLVVSGNKFVSGAKVMFGGAPLNTTFVSGSELAATGTATNAQVGVVVVTVQNPDPGSVVSTTSKNETVTSGQVATAAATVRFLEQSTFGPTPTLITQVEQTGFTPFLNDQFAAPMSTYPDPASTENSLFPTQQVFFTNALTGPDQLRQRVAFALSEVWVTSGNTIPPQGMAPYMRLLSQDAFTNYRTIMADVTLSPAMGRYLDMVNNDKPDATLNTHANENYAREFMQLFTLGLYLLNQDGSLQLDASNNPIPTYDQNTVQALARAYTGWTYPTQPGNVLQKHNPPYWLGPMVVFESNHDTAAKTLLRGVVLPAGQTSSQDLNGALDDIFNHPNIGPFVAKQLIQHLVTSNPSAGYVHRVADVFASGNFASFGSGQRGDMQAIIAAILLDPEARRGDDPNTAVATDGHLREPILYIANLLRAFGATSDGAGPVNFASSLSQGPLRSPSVFNFFPPDFVIPGTNMLGPEFDLQTTATALARANFVNSFVFGSIGGGTTVDFTPYATLAGTGVTQLLDSLNALMLHGTLSASARTSITNAVNAVPAGASQNLTRAKTAIYLIGSSSQYQIQH